MSIVIEVRALAQHLGVDRDHVADPAPAGGTSSPRPPPSPPGPRARPRARTEAPRSICAISQPPKMSPLALVSAGHRDRLQGQRAVAVRFRSSGSSAACAACCDPVYNAAPLVHSVEGNHAPPVLDQCRGVNSPMDYARIVDDLPHARPRGRATRSSRSTTAPTSRSGRSPTPRRSPRPTSAPTR